MRITYDRQADAAYVYLREIEPAGVARTVTVSAGPMLNLDFDRRTASSASKPFQATQ